MRLILVDTSVWIDFFNGTDTQENNMLESLLRKGSSISLCPTIIQEILQGISGTEEKVFSEVRQYLLKQIVLTCEPVQAAIESALLYKRLRQKGITVRKSNDCLIAYHALFYDAEVLHRDRDFKLMADHVGLRLYNKP